MVAGTEVPQDLNPIPQSGASSLGPDGQIILVQHQMTATAQAPPQRMNMDIVETEQRTHRVRKAPSQGSPVNLTPVKRGSEHESAEMH